MSAPIVILNPSGSVKAKSRVPQGWSRGSWSSLPPRATIFSARTSTSCVVVQYSRKPSPFFRSRPFFQSSCPIMKVTLPALRETPMSFPSCSQRSSTTNPTMSRYQARLFSRSFTVKPGDASLIFKAPELVRTFARAVFPFFEALFFEEALFVVFLFLTAISSLQLLLFFESGEIMTRGILEPRDLSARSTHVMPPRDTSRRRDQADEPLDTPAGARYIVCDWINY